MKSNNNFTLFGRLAADVKTFVSASGNTKASFCIVTDNGKDKEGNKRQAYFVDCVSWGTKAETIAKYFHKGDQILASGIIVTQMVTGTDGKSIKYQSLMVDDFSFISGERKEQPQDNIMSDKEQPAQDILMPDISDDDLPF